MFLPRLPEYSVIPNFIVAFRKYLLSILVTHRSSKIISLLLSAVLSSSVLSTSAILDYSTPLSLIRGLTVLQNFIANTN